MADVGAYTQALCKRSRWHFLLSLLWCFWLLMIMCASLNSAFKAKWEEDFWCCGVWCPYYGYELMDATSLVVYQGPQISQWIVESLSCGIRMVLDRARDVLSRMDVLPSASRAPKSRSFGIKISAINYTGLGNTFLLRQRRSDEHCNSTRLITSDFEGLQSVTT